jgi:hypothetical protein
VRTAEGLEIGHLFQQHSINGAAVEPDDAGNSAHAQAAKTESSV